MGVLSYSVHHAVHGLDAVAHAHTRIDGLADDLLATGAVRGVIVIPTCNRLEVLVEADEHPHLDAFIARRLDIPNAVRWEGREAITHIVRVAAGLDSLVVGEREVSGQVRRALTVAHNEHTSSPALSLIVKDALTVSRRIAHLTGLSSQGRSVVAAGLELAKDQVEADPRDWRVLLVGTGAYAGATVTALRALGTQDMSVYSRSDRAGRFADGHDLTPVNADGLVAAMAEADLTVTCRGLGSPVLDLADIEAARERRRDASGQPLVFLDLALMHDVPGEARDLEGVRLITMEDIRAQVPAAEAGQVHRAEQIVADGVADIEAELRQRAAVPAVKAVRDYITAALDDEMSRLPAGEQVSREEAEKALRRLAARLAHTPTIRAREAANGGRTREFADALEQVMGLTVLPSVNPVNDLASELETGTCPVTGMRLADLSTPASTPDAATSHPAEQETA